MGFATFPIHLSRANVPVFWTDCNQIEHIFWIRNSLLRKTSKINTGFDKFSYLKILAIRFEEINDLLVVDLKVRDFY